jgi:hypothetical protein
LFTKSLHQGTPNRAPQKVTHVYQLNHDGRGEICASEAEAFEEEPSPGGVIPKGAGWPGGDLGLVALKSLPDYSRFDFEPAGCI